MTSRAPQVLDARDTEFRRLLALHADVERLAREHGGRSFISGWNAANPFAAEFLGDLDATGLDATAYMSYTSDDRLLGLIRDMHHRFDGATPQRILPGDGSTGLIASMFLWLMRRRTASVHYVPTVHDTFYYFFDLLGLEVGRAADRHPFEPGFELNLPAERTTLFVSDPTWYVGRPLAREVVSEIAAWQRATESVVFVDGTWQYLQWGNDRYERSSALEDDLTVRLIGPTKFLGLNGYRFSYLLLPAWMYDDLADMHENLHGSTSVANLAFARRAMTVMNSADHNRRLTDHVRDLYATLSGAGDLTTELTPECGLYCFAKPRRALTDVVSMGGEYYELGGYPGYARINLLGGSELDVLRR